MAYHKDITEYFTLPPGATGTQPSVQGAYTTLMVLVAALVTFFTACTTLWIELLIVFLQIDEVEMGPI